jgi:hypothetical protein
VTISSCFISFLSFHLVSFVSFSFPSPLVGNLLIAFLFPKDEWQKRYETPLETYGKTANNHKENHRLTIYYSCFLLFASCLSSRPLIAGAGTRCMSLLPDSPTLGVPEEKLERRPCIRNTQRKRRKESKRKRKRRD